ncbi:ribosome maturation factor RimM [uncultured Allofournierella sp.]|uniref:ribosome maturation factor RimM n=1 Tax=uncultured Allofournierella sp. TaxID=1940258 RepID=UPI003750A98E
MKQYLEACKAVTTHGVAGEVKVELWCDDAAFLAKFKTLYRGPNGENPIQVKKVRAHKNMALVTFEGVEDMDAARAMVGQIFYLDRKDARLPKGHYFKVDLLGCALVDADSGRVYGTIRKVDTPAAQDIYTVECPDGSTALFPAVKPFLVQMDLEHSQVLVRPIPGMFSPADNGDQV